MNHVTFVVEVDGLRQTRVDDKQIVVNERRPARTRRILRMSPTYEHPPLQIGRKGKRTEPLAGIACTRPAPLTDQERQIVGSLCITRRSGRDHKGRENRDEQPSNATHRPAPVDGAALPSAKVQCSRARASTPS